MELDQKIKKVPALCSALKG